MVLKVVTYPVVEPITIEEARLHLRVDIDSDDSPPTNIDDNLIMWQLAAAREWCEQYLGFRVAQQTLELALDEFPDEIELPVWPVLSVESVKYIDEDGEEQTIDELDYIIDDYSRPATITPYTDLEWPETKVIANAVKVRFTQGYSMAGDSPQVYPFPYLVRAAILLVLGSLYEQREDSSPIKQESIPLGAMALLDLAGRERRGFA